ncbi:MAG TPA: MlaD family protein, partial [Longimicrobium sp.]|nr:MlaD family protein [Longimicrobium sp.]
PTRSPRREVQVGLFVLAGALAVIAALFILTDPGTFRGRYYVTTVVQDAGGIRKRDAVQLRGVNIGRVDDLSIEGDAVRLRLELEGDYRFPADSKVRLATKGLLQETVAEIVPGRASARAEDGAELRPDVEGAGGLGAMAEDLGGQADSVLSRAQLLLSRENIGAVSSSTRELQTLMAQLAALATEQRRELSTLSASLRRSAEGVESAATRPELARAIARTDSLTLRLDAATASLGQASASLANLTGRIDRGEGTLGKLATDDQLYNNLNTAVTNLAQLTEDIKKDPKKYLSVSVF